MPTEQQKRWMIETERKIRTEFPGDPFSDEEQSEKLIARIDEYDQAAHGNETVKRWLMEILVEYNNRWKILNTNRKTDNEYIRELYEKRRKQNEETRVD